MLWSRMGDEQLNLTAADLDVCSVTVKNTHLQLQYFEHSVQFCAVKTCDVHRIDISTQSLAVSACSCCLWWLTELWTLKQMVFLPLLRMLFTFAVWGQSEGAQLCLYSQSLSLSLSRFILTLPQRQYSVSCFLMLMPCWNNQMASLLYRLIWGRPFQKLSFNRFEAQFQAASKETDKHLHFYGLGLGSCCRGYLALWSELNRTVWRLV